jgi:hypothetical protein
VPIGFSYTLSNGTELRVRRCFDGERLETEVVELSVELGPDPYLQLCINLNPSQAALIGSYLHHEASNPIKEKVND